jgi:hypothetical protein
MENPSPFDLNEAIRCWQQNLSDSPAFKADNLEELASHLRASIQKLKADGLSEKEAFQIATQRIGERGALEREFAKVTPSVTWSSPVLLFWGVVAFFLLRAISCMSDMVLFLGLSFSRTHWDFIPFFRPFSMRLWLAFSGLPNLCHVTFLLVVVIALRLCWRLITGSWKGFNAFIVSRFEALARTKPVVTTLSLAAFAIMADYLHGPLVFRETNMMSLSSIGEILWGGLATEVAIDVALVLAMVWLARRGLRNTWPADGTGHNIATSKSRPDFSLAGFALLAAILPAITAVLAKKMAPAEVSWYLQIPWRELANDGAFNIVFVLIMVWLAHMGLRTMAPADGPLHTCAPNSSR